MQPDSHRYGEILAALLLWALLGDSAVADGPGGEVLVAQRGRAKPFEPPFERSRPGSNDPSSPETYEGTKLRDLMRGSDRSDPKHVEVDGRRYAVDADNLKIWRRMIGQQGPLQGPPRGFIIKRVVPETGSRPIYVLVTGHAEPLVFLGNTSLIYLVVRAKTEWSAQGGTPPPAFWMVGDGSRQDLDAALLTMRLGQPMQTSPNQVPGPVDTTRTRIDRMSTLDDLADLFAGRKNVTRPPAEFFTLPGFNYRDDLVRSSEASIVVSWGKRIGEYQFGFGTARVIGRTVQAVAIVLAAIREVILREFIQKKSVGDPTVASNAAVAELARNQAEWALQRYFNEEFDRFADRDSVDVELKLGDQTIKWSVSALDPAHPATRLAGAP